MRVHVSDRRGQSRVGEAAEEARGRVVAEVDQGLDEDPRGV
jgi:hypothetical protein